MVCWSIPILVDRSETLISHACKNGQLVSHLNGVQVHCNYNHYEYNSHENKHEHKHNGPHYQSYLTLVTLVMCLYMELWRRYK